MITTTVRPALAVLLQFGLALSAQAQDADPSRSIRVIEKVPEASTKDPLKTPPSGVAQPAPPATAGVAGDQRLPAPAADQPLTPPAQPTETVRLPAPGPAPSSEPAKPSVVSVNFIGKDRFGLGENIRVQVRTQAAGYLVLVDVSSDGHVTQIYPNIYSMAASGTDPASGNFVRAGEEVTVPDPSSPLANFEFMAGPPLGEGKIFAILSDKPVQYVDLPDLPVEIKGDQVASYVQDATRSLRITSAAGGPLLDPRWQFGAATYVIGTQSVQAGQ